MACSRRDFFRTAGCAGLASALSPVAGGRAWGSEPVSANDDALGVLVDLTKCNGCRRCEAACREAAGFSVPSEEELKDTSVFASTRRLGPTDYTIVNQFQISGNGAHPVYVKRNCLHCVDPACASACLVGALRKQPDGAVTYDANKCMGCRYCMVACPFEIPTYEYDNVFTPQVRKCTFCLGKDPFGNPKTPACVQACPKEVLTFGKRSELLARAHAKIAQHPDLYLDHVYGEREAGGTSWLYLSHVPFEKLGFMNLGSEAPPRLAESVQHGVFAYFIPPVAWCAVLGLSMWLTGSGRQWTPASDGERDEEDDGAAMNAAEEQDT